MTDLLGKDVSPEAKEEAEFISWMAARYQCKTQGHTADECLDLARQNFKATYSDEGVVFDDPRYGWSREDANELVDTDLSYWEDAE